MTIMSMAISNDTATLISAGDEHDPTPNRKSFFLAQPWYQAALMTWKIVSPLILIFGTFGNLMAIVILRRMSEKKSTIFLYLQALAVSDLVGLYIGLCRRWMNFQFGFNYVSVNDVVCKLNEWLLYTTYESSTWVLVTVTLQRAASVVWPHRMSVWCTRRKSRLVLVAVISLTMLFHAHLLYGMVFSSFVIANVTVFQDCIYFSPTSDYGRFFVEIWSAVYLSVSTLIPFSILLLGNSLLLVKVIRSLQEARQRLAVGSQVQVTARGKKTSSMTITLIVTSFAFFVLTSPYAVYINRFDYQAHAVSDDLVRFAFYQYVWVLTIQLKYANYAVNFYLYCLTGGRFRSEMRRILVGLRERFKRNPVWILWVSRHTRKR